MRRPGLRVSMGAPGRRRQGRRGPALSRVPGRGYPGDVSERPASGPGERPGEGGARPRRWGRRIALAALLGAVVVGVRAAGVPTSGEEVRAALAGLGPWAMAALLGAFLVRPLLFLPITPLWIAAGALFGWAEGTLAALFGTSLGAALGFGIARRMGRGFVEGRLRDRVPRWARMSEERGLTTVLALQLTPIMPHDLINGMAGVSGMPYRSFALGSLLGTLPIITVYAYVGQAVWAVPSPEFWAAVGLLTAMTILMLAWTRRRARRREASLTTRWSRGPETLDPEVERCEPDGP